MIMGLLGLLALLLGELWNLHTSYDPTTDIDFSRRLALPGTPRDLPETLLGRDHYGRDLAKVLVQGIHAFLGPGLLAATTACGFGLLLAITRPQRGGALPGERLVTLALASTPAVIWVLLASLASQRCLWGMGGMLGLTSIGHMAAELRARFQHLHQGGTLEGALAHGLSHRRITWYHLALLEGIPVLLRRSGYIAASMLWIEASLSYLGDFGAPPPTPSWGQVLKGLSPSLFRADPGPAFWIAMTPLLLICLTSLTLMATGKGLGTALERGPEKPAPLLRKGGNSR